MLLLAFSEVSGVVRYVATTAFAELADKGRAVLIEHVATHRRGEHGLLLALGHGARECGLLPVEFPDVSLGAGAASVGDDALAEGAGEYLRGSHDIDAHPRESRHQRADGALNELRRIDV